jgi:hypothetical protein
MKVEFPIFLDGRNIICTTEAATVKDVFKWVADMQEIFGDLVCERNGSVSEHVKLRVRNVDDNDFYEAYCYKGDANCFRAVKRYGVNKDKDRAGLFPKTRDDDNNYLPNNGWVVFNKEKKKDE